MQKAELILDPQTQIHNGQLALKELKALVQRRPDKLVINGKQYLYFSDWQILGAFFGITAYITETREINEEKPTEDGKWTLKEPKGFLARAVAMKDGKELSAAEAECMLDEKNWKGKPRFQARSMAQTRACAKTLRNCLQWVVRLPDSEFAEESVEEVQQGELPYD